MLTLLEILCWFCENWGNCCTNGGSITILQVAAMLWACFRHVDDIYIFNSASMGEVTAIPVWRKVIVEAAIGLVIVVITRSILAVQKLFYG